MYFYSHWHCHNIELSLQQKDCEVFCNKIQEHIVLERLIIGKDDHLQEAIPSRTTTTTRVTMGHQDDRGDGTEGGGERVEGKIGADGTGSNCLQEVLADLIKKK